MMLEKSQTINYRFEVFGHGTSVPLYSKDCDHNEYSRFLYKCGAALSDDSLNEKEGNYRLDITELSDDGFEVIGLNSRFFFNRVTHNFINLFENS